MGLSAQDLRVEALVFREIGTLYAEEILERPCYVVAFDDFWRDCHSALEAFLCCLGMRGQSDHDIGGESAPHALGIGHDPVLKPANSSTLSLSRIDRRNERRAARDHHAERGG